MTRVLKEPLVHFLLMGGAIFAIAAWRGGGNEVATTPDVAAPDQSAAAESRERAAARIEIDAGVTRRLRDGWRRQFNRPPTEAELRGLVEQHLKEEVLYREALAMGLDREDSIVRRRMAQKMEFLTEDVTQSAAPDEAAVARYFEQNGGRYAEPGRVSFRHVYFSQAKRGASLDADAKTALSELAKSPAAEDAMGDAFLYEFEFKDVSEREVADALGSEFATGLAGLAAGQWAGPVASSYGLHLVLVTGRTPPQAVKLANVRETVLRDFAEARRQDSNQLVFQSLKAKYQVVVDESAMKAEDDELLKPLGMAK